MKTGGDQSNHITPADSGEVCAGWACSDPVVLCEMRSRQPLCRFHALAARLIAVQAGPDPGSVRRTMRAAMERGDDER